MQGKALTALATLLAALALAACGGGDEGGETSTGGAETSQAPDVAQIQERAGEIEKQRKGEDGDAKPDSRKDPGDGGSEQRGSATPNGGPDPPAPVEHSDSGGGVAQFQRKGSDNSIQEFGQEGGGSDFSSAAAVLHAYLDARAARDWDEACSHLSAEVIAGLEQFAAAYAGDKQIEGCPDVLESLSASTSTSTLKESAKADVGSLRMEGDRGFLLYHGAGGAELAIPVTQEGGEWKLAAPDATPLP